MHTACSMRATRIFVTLSSRRNSCGSEAAAFSLIELLVVIAILGILAAMLLPAVGRAKETAKRIGCLNNIRQLSLATHMYVDDNQGHYPPRWGNTNQMTASRWPDKFYDLYGKNLKLLLCLSETVTNPASGGGGGSVNLADNAPRSYLINGWDDYFQNLNAPPPTRQQRGRGGRGRGGMSGNQGVSRNPNLGMNRGDSMNENSILHISDTIVLGEKRSGNVDFYMDLNENGGNDFSGVLQESRHDSRGPDKDTGGSNYAFADGSARFMKVHTALNPLHLWCISDASRTRYAIVP